jgi:hypothetical protein
MARWQLTSKPLCVFVDAYDLDDLHLDNLNRKPKEIPKAHVLDLDAGKYTWLDDTQAFIARFIVLGVDTDLIPQIVKSEYEASVTNPSQAVTDVCDKLKAYLEPRKKIRPHRPPQHGEDPHPGGYDLDFKVNALGTGVIKVPI